MDDPLVELLTLPNSFKVFTIDLDYVLFINDIIEKFLTRLYQCQAFYYLPLQEP